MKLNTILLFCWIFATVAKTTAQSCCCVSAGANYSIVPNLSKNFIGIRYAYTGLQMTAKSLNPDLNGQKTNGYINQAELSGRFNLNNKLQLSVFVPVIFINQRSQSSNNRTGGLGDLTILLQYAVLDPLKCGGGESKHQLRLGIGSKLPSGEFRKMENNLYSTSVQAGSGSIDFIANAIYTYRYRSFGLNASALYKLNTTNSYSFRFGNKADASLNLFYLFPIHEVTLAPTVAVSYSHFFANYSYGKKIYATDADLLTAKLGLDVYLPYITLNFTVSPVAYNKVPFMSFKQQLGGELAIYYNFEIIKRK